MRPRSLSWPMASMSIFAKASRSGGSPPWSCGCMVCPGGEWSAWTVADEGRMGNPSCDHEGTKEKRKGPGTVAAPGPPHSFAPIRGASLLRLPLRLEGPRLLGADQAVAVRVDLLEQLLAAQPLLLRHVAVAVAVHPREPRRQVLLRRQLRRRRALAEEEERVARDDQ